MTRDVKAGEPLSADNVRSVRPAAGLRTDRFAELEGRPFLVDVKAGTPLSLDLL